jgi:hypothetical protein
MTFDLNNYFALDQEKTGWSMEKTASLSTFVHSCVLSQLEFDRAQTDPPQKRDFGV